MRAHRPTSRRLAHTDGLPSDRLNADERHLRPVEPPPQDYPRLASHGGPSRNDVLSFPVFRSILFPPGSEHERADRHEQPACFVDLNLDQVVTALIANQDEDVLRPISYTTYRNDDIICYRQAVFADLECAEVFQAFPVFCETMRTVRANLNYADKISYKRHRHMVVLRAIHIYCEGVQSLLQSLETLTLQSAGLMGLRRYLASYTESEAFSQLATGGRRLREVLSNLSYGTLFRGGKVNVRKYASEPDYAVTVLERFARFRETNIEPPAPEGQKTTFRSITSKRASSNSSGAFSRTSSVLWKTTSRTIPGSSMT